MSFEKFDEKFASIFIQGLKNGNVLWQKPFIADLHRNATTGKAYRGWNSVWFSIVADMCGYESQLWITFEQLKAHIKKTGEIVEFKGQSTTTGAYYPIVGEKRDENGEIIKRGFPAPKAFFVFNVDQIKGLNIENFKKAIVPQNSQTSNQKAEEIAAKCIEVLKVGVQLDAKDEAYFSEEYNLVKTPPMKNYPILANYYGVLFHELIHATGAKAHLNRKSLAEYHESKDIRGMEELIAEIGSAMLLSRCGLLDSLVLENKQAYCNGWAQALVENKPDMIRKAATAAAKAVEYLLDANESEENEQSKELAHS